MKQLLLAGGATLARRIMREHRRACGNELIYKSVVDGRAYYNLKVPRDPKEIEAMVKKGANPKSAGVIYRNRYLGTEAPEGFEGDLISILKNEGRLSFAGTNLITDEQTAEALCEAYPAFLNCKTFVLDEGEEV